MPFPLLARLGLGDPSGWYHSGAGAEYSTFAGAGELACQTRVLDTLTPLSM